MYSSKSFFPLFDFQCITYTIVSDFVTEGTPVPIPNTVVKLSYAYNTWREAAREDWSSLTFKAVAFATAFSLFKKGM